MGRPHRPRYPARGGVILRPLTRKSSNSRFFSQSLRAVPVAGAPRVGWGLFYEDCQNLWLTMRWVAFKINPARG